MQIINTELSPVVVAEVAFRQIVAQVALGAVRMHVLHAAFEMLKWTSIVFVRAGYVPTPKRKRPDAVCIRALKGRFQVNQPVAGQAARSNRSAFITFVQAETKSLTNFSLLSSWA